MIPAIVLAAGASRRMGRPKQLIEFEGEPLVCRAARMALEAGCMPVLVIVGSDAEAVGSGISGLAITTVLNPEWEEGMASSIRVGIRALPQDSDAALLLACDQPAMDTAFLLRMIAAHCADRKRIIASGYAGIVGIPALFPRSSFAELEGLSGDRGARRLLENEGVLSLPLPGGELDLDTPEDLRRSAGI